ncbi:hypothetical protein ACFL3I_02185 [Pseudomonadota bacterium]
MSVDAFESPGTLAKWAAGVVVKAEISEVARWRMLEYWMQVELYRYLEKGTVGEWKHLGEHEQPYYTTLPRSGSKFNSKWVDLVVAEPSLERPQRIVWIELKDIGRSEHRLKANASGLGQDLAALYRLDPQMTQDLWLRPPPHIVDIGRAAEWERFADGIVSADHLIAQIVLVPKQFANEEHEAVLIENWLKTFKSRTGSNLKADKIVRAEAGEFSIYATVLSLPEYS